MARVVLEHLTKVFKGPKGECVRAVDDASLTVEPNEFLVLVGPSGCGKTTTLRLIAGLEEVTAGTVAIDGKIVNAVAPKDRDIEMVFQHYALYPHMTVYENLAFGLKVRKLPRAEIEGRVKEAAEVFGLAACLDRKPGELSGGQRQRVAVGRALVRRPKVFLFDEPLSNLDATLRQQMRAELSRLHRRLAATMIYVTHDQVEAMTLGNRIAVMKDGKIQQVADPMQLYRRPADLFVAEFIGSPPINVLNGMLVSERNGLRFQEQNGGAATTQPLIALELDHAAAQPLQAYVGKQILLGIRPEDLTHSPPGQIPPPGRTVETLVEFVQPMGSETHVHLVSGGHTFVARVPPSCPVRANQRAAFVVEIRNAHFFDPATGKAILP
jgi:multiple sugar transport system ATP-binding protein